MITFIITILFNVQKKQQSFTHELLVVKSNYESELSKAQIEIHEQTCKQISRDIHDNVGQVLTLARLGLVTLNLGKKDEAKESIVEISEVLEKALDDLRHLTRMMNSEIISKGGLKKSIETQVGYIRRGGKYNIYFEVNDEPELVNHEKDVIHFRIVQEALNNIIRHASASEICICLHYDTQFMKLQIRDNGKGFDLNEKYSGTKTINGIRNMQHRAKLIGAKFVIESQPDKGTQITITTPIN
jgi:signal transduction histidine kinase